LKKIFLIEFKLKGPLTLEFISKSYLILNKFLRWFSVFDNISMKVYLRNGKNLALRTESNAGKINQAM
jgi:hypothetical protein